MKITKLILNNIGVYADKTTFNFGSGKPIILIGGLNGRGKTTILYAIALALYGYKSPYINKKNYIKYLQSLQNTKNISYVDLEIKLEDNTYYLKRSWDDKGKEVFSVLKNNILNTYLSDNWLDFWESMLPSDLAKLFLFDGEQITKYAENMGSIVDKIRQFLGLSVIDDLYKNIKKIERNTIKQLNNNITTDDLTRLQQAKDTQQKQLILLDRQIQQLKQDEQNIKNVIDNLNKQQYNIINKTNERNILNEKQIQVKNNLISLTSKELPFLLVLGLIKEAEEQAKKESSNKLYNKILNKVKEYKKESTELDGFLNFCKKDLNDINLELSYYNYTHLYNQIEQVSTDLKNNLDKYNNINIELNQLKEYIELENNELLKDIQNELKKQEKLYIDIKIKLKELEFNRSKINGEYIRQNAEYKRILEETVTKLDDIDDNKRIIKYTNFIKTVLENYKIKLQENKIKNIANTMTDCYKILANKKDLINRIDIDPITLKFKYYNNDIEIKNLSTGEKQLIVICFLWSLNICNKIKLPVIIDTPLARLDYNHRTKLVTKYFPFAGNQTIILSTDTEINQDLYNCMIDNVGDSYTLIYNDIARTTTIAQGYLFGGESNY